MARGSKREVFAFIVCDHPDCCIRRESVSVRDLVDDGWFFTVSTGQDWCPDHKVYGMPECKFCGTKMRPQKESARLWPGTAARGTGGHCMTCTESRYKYEGDLDRAINYYWRLNHG